MAENDAPAATQDRVSEKTESSDSSSSLSSSADMTSPSSNASVSEMNKSSLQDSQNKIDSWNSVSIDMGNNSSSSSSSQNGSGSEGARSAGSDSTASQNGADGSEGGNKTPRPDGKSQQAGDFQLGGNNGSNAGQPSTSGLETVNFPHAKPQQPGPALGPSSSGSDTIKSNQGPQKPSAGPDGGANPKNSEVLRPGQGASISASVTTRIRR